MNIKHGTFTPLAFSVSGGMGKECSMFHKPVAERLEIKTCERYEKIVSTIRCKVLFLILKSALMCIRGSRSHTLKTINKFELVSHLAKIESNKIHMCIHVRPFTFIWGLVLLHSFMVTLLKIKNCSFIFYMLTILN